MEQNLGSGLDDSVSHRGTATRKYIGISIVLIAITLVMGYQFASGQETLDAWKFSHDSALGRKIAPVALNLQGRDPDLVYLGSYIVNAQGGCNDCHTCPSYKGIDPYKVGGRGLGPTNDPGPVNTANYLAGGTPFQSSTIVSPNLTPISGLPGGLTYDNFKTSMQDGISSHKSDHILQVMPWPVFRKMTESDLRAIYEYLSAIPSALPGTCTGSH